MERTNSGAFLLIIFLLLTAYLMPLYEDGRSANEMTDWATAAALVEHNSFDLSQIKKETGVDFESVVVRDDGSIYSAKPPGLAFVSAPFYAITRTIIGAPNSGNVRTSWYVLRLVLSSFPLLLLGLWLYNREVDSFSLAALLFATPMFPYALLYYPHVFVAILVYMGFRLIYDPRRVMPGTCFSAAFLLGIAITCDYAAVVPAIIFGIGLIGTERIERSRRMVFYLAGVLPPIAALLLYNFFVFDSPLAFLSFTEFSLPTLNAVYLYLISPSHGLLIFAPIFVFAFLVLLGGEDAGRTRHVVKVAAVLLTFVAVCGGGEKFGGAAVGPRHMILILPLLLDSFFDGEIEEYPSHWRGLIFTVSFLFCTIPMLTYPFANAALQFPHNSFWVPLLVDGKYGFSIANTVGYPITYRTILPAAILLFVALFFVWRDAKSRVPFAIGMFIGAGIAAIYFFAVTLEPEMGTRLVQEAASIH